MNTLAVDIILFKEVIDQLERAQMDFFVDKTQYVIDKLKLAIKNNNEDSKVLAVLLKLLLLQTDNEHLVVELKKQLNHRSLDIEIINHWEYELPIIKTFKL